MPSVPFAHGAMTPVVAAISEIETLFAAPPTIVGGIAVLCRAGTAYRATSDLDAVCSTPLGSRGLLEVLRESARAEDAGPYGVDLDTEFGTARVDVIDVRPLSAGDRFNDAADRVYAMAHIWALESATQMRLVVMEGTSEVTSAVARIAEPGPLVAMKLQSAPDRGSAKEGTDLLDIVRLALNPVTAGAVFQDLRNCHSDLAADCRVLAQRLLEDGRRRSLSRIHATGAEDVTMAMLGDVLALIDSATER